MVVNTPTSTCPLQDGFDAVGQAPQSSETLETIRFLVDKYTYKWTERKILPEVRTNFTKERIVVTGTTGALGSHLLASLLENENVETVWALNRKSKGVLITRQKAAFEDKMLDLSLLYSIKLVMLEVDLEDARLGLREDVYQEIQTGATAIIHNAWAVNFRNGLQAFEPSIRGVRHLLNLAFSSPKPPRFLFASSLTTAGFGNPSRPIRENYLTPEYGAETMGYGQSKLVTEMLLQSARAAGLETCVMRLATLTGDDKSGSWSKNDWAPALIASSVSVGYLPDAIGEVSWLPLDITARTIVDASLIRGEILPPVINTSHPRPVRWTNIMKIFQEVFRSHAGNGQALSIVPYQEWNERVKSAASRVEGPRRNGYMRFPTTRLQEVFDRVARADQALREIKEDMNAEAFLGAAKLEINQGMRLSESLRNAPSLGREHVEKWVSYWGLFESSCSGNAVRSTLRREKANVPLARL